MPATDNRILKIQFLSLPELLFEFHVATKQVYVIPLGKTIIKEGQPFLEATLIGQFVEDATQAKNVAGAWCDGYKMGLQQPKRLEIVG